MSYQVLARKWRPRNFSEVVGQQHVLQALTNALTHQRLHHAYLLTGTRGVGKTTIARILSRSLNCAQGITATPCGECSACVDIEAGRFVDLLEIDAASRTKVEDTREILENVQYRPTSGRYKVYLIDEVHMLSRHSFNALLKTLEEPPPHVIFLLATTDPEKLPVTVLSRCLQFHLRALTREEISQQLAHILTAEGLVFEPAALALLARSANGSMRDALSLTDQAIAQGNQQVQEALVAQMLGRIDAVNLLSLLETITIGDSGSVLASLRGLVDKIPDIGGVLAELQSLLHQLALVQVAPALVDSELLPHSEQLHTMAARIAPAQVQVYYRIVLDGRRELPYAPDAFSGVEMTLLRMLAFRPVTSEEPHAGKPLVDKPSSSAPAQEPPQKLGSVSTFSGTTPAEPEKLGSVSTFSGTTPAEPEKLGSDPIISGTLSGGDEDDAVPGYLESDDDDDSAALFAEQAGIEQQAEAVRPASVAANAPSVLPSDVTSTATSAASATNSAPDLKSLLATRNQLVGKRGAQTPGQAAAVTSAPTRERTVAPTPAAPEQAAPKPAEPEPAAPQPAEPEQRYQPQQAQQQQPRQEQQQPRQEQQQPRQEQQQLRQEHKQQQQLPSRVVQAAEVDAWAAQIERLGVVGRTRQVLLHAQLHEQGEELLLEVAADMQGLLSGHMHASIKHELAAIIANRPFRIELGNPPRTPFRIQQEIDANLQQQAQQSVAEHAGIQALQQAFSAQIKQVKVIH